MWKDAIFTVYCDDGIFFAKSDLAIDEAVRSLQIPLLDSEGNQLPHGYAFDLDKESNLASYLDIELSTKADGSLLMV